MVDGTPWALSRHLAGRLTVHRWTPGPPPHPVFAIGERVATGPRSRGDRRARRSPGVVARRAGGGRRPRSAGSAGRRLPRRGSHPPARGVRPERRVRVGPGGPGAPPPAAVAPLARHPGGRRRVRCAHPLRAVRDPGRRDGRDRGDDDHRRPTDRAGARPGPGRGGSPDRRPAARALPGVPALGGRRAGDRGRRSAARGDASGAAGAGRGGGGHGGGPDRGGPAPARGLRPAAGGLVASEPPRGARRGGGDGLGDDSWDRGGGRTRDRGGGPPPPDARRARVDRGGRGPDGCCSARATRREGSGRGRRRARAAVAGPTARMGGPPSGRRRC